jgi:hypothetical protein
MPTIKASINNADRFFYLDGLDYEKGVYTLYYDSVEINTAKEINESVIRVGIRSKSEFNRVLVRPKLVTNWTDGTTPYSDFDTLIADISTLIVGPVTAQGLSITQNVLNYAALDDGDTAGDLAYVRESQGTAWLSAISLGNYYPAGWYVWSGSDWVSDRNAIADQLEALVNETVAIGVACSDETTALTTGTAKVTFRMPYALTLTEVRANLTGAGSTSGTTTVDINESGTSVLSTKLTIDNTEKTSTTAAVPAVISDSSLADDAEITIDFDAVTGGADETGLVVWLIGTRV